MLIKTTLKWFKTTNGRFAGTGPVAVAALLVAQFATKAVAAELPPEWSGAVQLGLVMTSGNSDTQTLSGKWTLVREVEDWRSGLRLEGINQSSNDSRAVERYLGALQQDYKFTERQYAFARSEYMTERFTGFEYELTASVGYGRRLIDGEYHLLEVEAGPGYRRTRLEDTQEVREDAILRSSLNYEWNMTETASFAEVLTNETGSEKSVTKSVTSLQTVINNDFSLALGFTVRHTSVVPDTKKKVDTETTVSIAYGY